MANYSIISLYSGSKGNSVLIESEDTRILIDAGKSARALCSALEGIGRKISEIDAIFITHEHTDHTSALEILLKKNRIPVHVVEVSARKMFLRGLWDYADVICTHSPRYSVQVGNMLISSFDTPHDSDYSVGYRIAIGGDDEKTVIGYATDIGYVSDELKNALRGCESVVLECNHDLRMLMEGPYPYDLKLRIKSNRGHLSNSDCALFVSELCSQGTRNILLAHLSEENNDPALAYGAVWNAITDESINLKVASQYEAVKLI